jgi:hypothetical protein
MQTNAEDHEATADVSVRIKGTSAKRETGALRRFFRGTFKLALALIITGVVLGAIAALIAGGVYWHEQSRNRPLAFPNFLNPITIPSLENTTFTLMTKWVDSQMYYQLRVDGFPAEVKKHFDPVADPFGRRSTSRAAEGSFTVVLSDAMGFKIQDILIPLNSMTRVVSPSNTYSGLSIKNTTYMSADKYREVSSWEVQWSL